MDTYSWYRRRARFPPLPRRHHTLAGEELKGLDERLHLGAYNEAIPELLDLDRRRDVHHARFLYQHRERGLSSSIRRDSRAGGRRQ